MAYSYTSLGPVSAWTALWYGRRKRAIFGIFTLVLVLGITTHAALFAEENQYQHAFSHVASAIPALRRSGLTFDARLGLATVDKSRLTTHPVRALMERAEGLYEEQQKRIAAIETLEDAVEDYRRAFGMDPPRGFDTWYEWTVENGAIPVPSMIGQAVLPVKQFLSYPPEILRNRLYADQHEAYAFCVVFQREGEGMVLNVTTPQVHKRKYWSPPAVKELWEPLVPLLPRPFEEDPDTFLIFGWEDAPVRVASVEIMEKSKELADAGLMWDPDALSEMEHNTLWRYGWQQMCPHDSPFRQMPQIKMEHDMKVMYPYRDDVPHDPKTFMYDNQASMNWCENPLLTQLSNTLVQDFWRRSGPMIPMFGQSRLHNSPEITWTPTMAFGQTAPENEWQDKVFGKLLWRGSPTGMLHANTTAWRAQQRHRIAHLVNHPSGTRQVIVEEEGYLGSPVAEMREYPTSDLVEKYTNISFIGQSNKPPFCWHDGTCAELERDLIYHARVEPTEAVKFRYILDIDGWGWSSRFRRELTTGSVLFKATIYPEWYFDIIIPWYHYVPLQMDYSDLFDTLAFFEGAPDGSTPGNQHLAKKIGERGKQFVKDRWRKEDLQSFGLLQLMEYQRMWSSNRKKATFGYRG